MNSQSVENAQATATSFVSRQLDQRRHTLAEHVGTHAKSLRTIAGSLRDGDGSQPAAEAADRLAAYAERAESYLHDRDVNGVIVDLESFSRTRPWATATVALVAGFAASRFLKTSSISRYRSAFSGS